MPQDLIGCQKRWKLKALIPCLDVFVNDPSSVERRIDFAVFFLVLWSYGMKICLTCALEIQKIHVVVHIFSGFALITESECITELNPSASCWPLTRCILIYQQTGANQNTVHLKTGFIWKFSREWLLWTGYKWRLTAKETSIANCEVLDE